MHTAHFDMELEREKKKMVFWLTIQLFHNNSTLIVCCAVSRGIECKITLNSATSNWKFIYLNLLAFFYSASGNLCGKWKIKIKACAASRAIASVEKWIIHKKIEIKMFTNKMFVCFLFIYLSFFLICALLCCVPSSIWYYVDVVVIATAIILLLLHFISNKLLAISVQFPSPLNSISSHFAYN